MCTADIGPLKVCVVAFLPANVETCSYSFSFMYMQPQSKLKWVNCCRPSATTHSPTSPLLVATLMLWQPSCSAACAQRGSQAESPPSKCCHSSSLPALTRAHFPVTCISLAMCFLRLEALLFRTSTLPTSRHWRFDWPGSSN